MCRNIKDKSKSKTNSYYFFYFFRELIHFYTRNTSDVCALKDEIVEIDVIYVMVSHDVKCAFCRSTRIPANIRSRLTISRNCLPSIRFHEIEMTLFFLKRYYSSQL